MADENKTVDTGNQTPSDTKTTWYDSLNLSDENKAVVNTKNFKDVNDLIKSYVNIEKLAGVDKSELIRIPKAKEGEEPDYSEVYKALGRPDKSSDYELPDNDFAKAAAEEMFKQGLTKKQAKALSEWVSQYSEGQASASRKKYEEEKESAAAKQIEALKKEWAADYDLNIEISKQAVADLQESLGLDGEVLDKLGDYIGVDRATKIFYMLGKAYSKGDGSKEIKNYVNKSGGETPERAAERLKELNADPETAKKLKANDPKIVEELNRLNAIIVESKFGGAK